MSIILSCVSSCFLSEFLNKKPRGFMQSSCLSLGCAVLTKHIQKVGNNLLPICCCVFVLYFRCLNEFYYIFVKVQLL